MDRSTTGILSTIGGTPLVELSRLFNEEFRVYAKLEGFNPCGSAKDRVALSMVADRVGQAALTSGKSVVVESSSGNLGIGLAQVCNLLDLRFICVVDPNTPKQSIAMIRAYGAEVELVESPDPATGEYLPARLRRVQEIVAQTPDAYWTNQYANLMNARAHERTMMEIVQQLDNRVDFLFCALSSCGMLRGCADYVRENGLQTQIIAVDAVGSSIFPGQPRVRRLIPGHGAASRSALMRDDLASEVVHISDAECIAGCRELVKAESILAGGSSGAVISAVRKKASSLTRGANCVIVLADRGERYLDTIYDDEWVFRNFGDAPLARRDTTDRGPVNADLVAS